MLYFHQQRLAFLEVPKTGSSAVVAALRDDASMAIRRPPAMRHMNVAAFNARARDFIENSWDGPVETFAVMREPVDRLVSWYRFLQRVPLPGAPESTLGLTFEDFVAAVLAGEDRFAGIGRQDRFLMRDGKVQLVTHLFAYDRQDVLLEFLSRRFNREIAFERVNVSTSQPVEVSPATRDAIRRGRPREWALWSAVAAAGYRHAPEV